MITELLRSHKNPEKAVKQAKYMRDQFDYIGLSTPEIRELTKDFMKEKCKNKTVDWDFVQEMWKQPEREFQYVACQYLIKLKKFLVKSDFAKILEIAVQKSWWDSIDNLDELIGALVKSDEIGETEILELSKAENFWLRRLAIDHQLSFKLETNEKLLAQVLKNNFGSDEFFINKAIGWALRDYSKWNPDFVRDFIAENQAKMDKLSVKEAGKYLVKSDKK